MTEARITGFMANYLRMYWAKKIMEWSSSMETAYEIIIYLNNKYLIDGRNPNSYSNYRMVWQMIDHGKNVHIGSSIRYMNAAGLKKKFDMDTYVSWVNTLSKTRIRGHFYKASFYICYTNLAFGYI